MTNLRFFSKSVYVPICFYRSTFNVLLLDFDCTSFNIDKSKHHTRRRTVYANTTTNVLIVSPMTWTLYVIHCLQGPPHNKTRHERLSTTGSAAAARASFRLENPHFWPLTCVRHLAGTHHEPASGGAGHASWPDAGAYAVASGATAWQHPPAASRGAGPLLTPDCIQLCRKFCSHVTGACFLKYIQECTKNCSSSFTNASCTGELRLFLLRLIPL